MLKLFSYLLTIVVAKLRQITNKRFLKEYLDYSKLMLINQRMELSTQLLVSDRAHLLFT